MDVPNKPIRTPCEQQKTRLLKENGEIRQELAEVRQANQTLRTEFDRLSGRYEELKDWVMAGRLG